MKKGGNRKFASKRMANNKGPSVTLGTIVANKQKPGQLIVKMTMVGKAAVSMAIDETFKNMGFESDEDHTSQNSEESSEEDKVSRESPDSHCQKQSRNSAPPNYAPTDLIEMRIVMVAIRILQAKSVRDIHPTKANMPDMRFKENKDEFPELTKTGFN